MIATREFPSVWWDNEGNLCSTDGAGGRSYVMVQFEKPMMECVAELLCRNGGNVLNIGFGCGLVDDAISKYPVQSHTIVEAHPQVYQHMLDLGWSQKANVSILHERWQDVPWSNKYQHYFDGIFWDPFNFDGGRESFVLDRFLWCRVASRIVRPKTGVFVLYTVAANPSVSTKMARWFPGIPIEPGVISCVVDVPFEIPEWRALGPGKHRIFIPYFRLMEE